MDQGKSTLLNIIAGLKQPTYGEYGATVRIGYFKQADMT